MIDDRFKYFLTTFDLKLEKNIFEYKNLKNELNMVKKNLMKS